MKIPVTHVVAFERRSFDGNECVNREGLGMLRHAAKGALSTNV